MQVSVNMQIPTAAPARHWLFLFLRPLVHLILQHFLRLDPGHHPAALFLTPLVLDENQQRSDQDCECHCWRLRLPQRLLFLLPSLLFLQHAWTLAFLVVATQAYPALQRHPPLCSQKLEWGQERCSLQIPSCLQLHLPTWKAQSLKMKYVKMNLCSECNQASISTPMSHPIFADALSTEVRCKESLSGQHLRIYAKCSWREHSNRRGTQALTWQGKDAGLLASSFWWVVLQRHTLGCPHNPQWLL